MASSRGKNSHKSLKRRVLSVLGPPTDRRLIIDLLKEMHHIVLDTAAELGVSAVDRRRALALAGKDKKRRRPSLSTIEPSYQLAGVLARWRFDNRFHIPTSTDGGEIVKVQDPSNFFGVLSLNGDLLYHIL